MEPLVAHDVLPAWVLDLASGVADVPGVEIYMDALPFPGRAGGTRFTTTEEDRGIICESSFNSATNEVIRRGTALIQARDKQTFSRRTVEHSEVKVSGFSKVIGENDLFFKLKHRDAGAIEGHLRLLSLGLELVKDGRGHAA
jgi:hypothetical protein